MKTGDWLTWALAILVGLTAASCATQVGKQPAILSDTRSQTPDSELRTVKVTYARLPLHFEPNHGQADERVHFLSRGRGYTLFLTATEAVLALRKPRRDSQDSFPLVLDSLSSPPPLRAHHTTLLGREKREPCKIPLRYGLPLCQRGIKGDFRPAAVPLSKKGCDISRLPFFLFENCRVVSPLRGRIKERGIKRDPEPIEQTVLHMQLIAANPNPRVAGQKELPGKVNYFIGNDPDKWRTNIPTYAKVKYQDVYPGVDLVYYGNQRQLEFDLVVAPSADPRVIRLAFDDLVGARRAVPLQIADNGDLILHIDGGEVRLRKSVVYQEINGVRQEISGRYVLLQPETSNFPTPNPRTPNPKTPDSELRDSELKQVGFEIAA